MKNNFEDELQLLNNEENYLKMIKNNLEENEENEENNLYSNYDYIDTITNITNTNNLDSSVNNKVFSDLDISSRFDNRDKVSMLSSFDNDPFNDDDDYKNNLETEISKINSGQMENIRRSMKMDVSRNITNFKKTNFERKKDKDDKKIMDKKGEKTPNKTPVRTPNRTPVKSLLSTGNGKFSAGKNKNFELNKK